MSGCCTKSCGCGKPPKPEGSTRLWVACTLALLVLWGVVFSWLPEVADAVVDLLPLPHDAAEHGGLREALRFFIYDAPKVLLLLALISFVMGVIRSFISPVQTRALLSGRRTGVGNVMAACLGTVTPFCSCSAISLFVGFVTAGVPLGVTLSFLISAPMVNEIAVGLLWGLVGWKVALAYMGFGLIIAIVAGWIIGRFRLEHWLEDWVQEQRAETTQVADAAPSVIGRIKAGLTSMHEIVGKIWHWILAGIAIGALIHGYAPADLLASIMGRDSFWSVPAAVLIGIPLYSNAAGVIPIVEALLGKGAALGTVLAFMMAVTALSLPEAIILRRVLKPRLIALFFAIVTTGILAVGFLFNAFIG